MFLLGPKVSFFCLLSCLTLRKRRQEQYLSPYKRVLNNKVERRDGSSLRLLDTPFWYLCWHFNALFFLPDFSSFQLLFNVFESIQIIRAIWRKGDWQSVSWIFVPLQNIVLLLEVGYDAWNEGNVQGLILVYLLILIIHITEHASNRDNKRGIP